MYVLGGDFISQDLNLYAYVLNNPLYWIYLDGLSRTGGRSLYGGRGTSGNPRPIGRNLQGKKGSWYKGVFYPSMGEPVPLRPSDRNQWEKFNPSDMLPTPSDWHDFLKDRDLGNSCRLVCGENNDNLLSCDVNYDGSSVSSCRVVCH
jgi:hypothetical protein